VLAKERYGLRGRDLGREGATLVPFTAQTRMSGVDLDGRRRQIRKGAPTPCALVRGRGGAFPPELRRSVETHRPRGRHAAGGRRRRAASSASSISRTSSRAASERFAELRRMGIRTVMITGDNPLTAAAIAAEAGVDDFLAEATPEDKLAS
jgi:potassium-transporting ATPase ATP-binding subunit